MKKIRTKILSVILIVSLLLSVFAIQVFANQNSIQYTSVADHYFDTLTDIPLNIFGSCSYVAMSMLLHFYDLYWADAFVPDNYEYVIDEIGDHYGSSYSFCSVPYSNPDIKVETLQLTATDEASKTAYMNFVRNNADEYLHMKLIYIGETLGFVNDADSLLGLTFSQAVLVLDEYFDQIFGERDYYREDENYDSDLPVTIHIVKESTPENDYNSVINVIRNQVAQGNPVCYSGSSDTGGHAMVAYALNNNDIELITAQPGKQPYSTIASTEYEDNISALWIEINENVLPHACSGNYKYGSETDFVCSCKVYRTLHRAHTHDPKSTYLSYDDTVHQYKCKWGCDIILEDTHRFSCQDAGGGMHLGTCACGYTKLLPHHMVRRNTYFLCLDCGYTRYDNGDITPWPGIYKIDDKEETE